MIEFKLNVSIIVNEQVMWGVLTVVADHIDTAIQIAEHKGYTVKGQVE